MPTRINSMALQGFYGFGVNIPCGEASRAYRFDLALCQMIKQRFRHNRTAGITRT